MSERIELWQRLLSPQHAALRAAAAGCEPGDVAAMTRLRRSTGEGGAELVTAAMELAAARRKAAVKFPGLAEELVAEVEGVEQATSRAVGLHKAARFRRVLGEGGRVPDLCCGIGGDAMSLREAGLEPMGVDHDPLRAWMCGVNAGCETAAADVREVAVRGEAIHLDPARRVEATRLPGGRGSRRVWRLRDIMPGPEIIRDLIGQARGVAVKLAPGVDREELATAGLCGPGDEVEWVSEAGRLVQAVLWTGELARGEAERSATLVLPGVPGVADAWPTVHTLRATPGESSDLPIAEPRRYLLTVDPAPERAGLLGVLSHRLKVPAIHERLGLLTGDTLPHSPWTTPFELVERMPWRERRVAAWLHGHDAGTVEIKTRGKAVDPDHFQPRLNGRGDTPYTLFILRFGRRIETLITRRLPTA